MSVDSWSVVTIGQLIKDGVILAHKDGNHGSNYPRTTEFGDQGVPFLSAKLLDNAGNIDFKNAPRLNFEKAKKITFGYIETDDVLLSHNATVGRVAVVPDIKEKALIGTSLTHFRLNKGKLLPQYLAAFFSGKNFQNQLAAVMSQTTRDQVPITSQRSLSIIVPPIDDQRLIADILSSFDKKISLNTQTNQTLEAIAQAIFKSWFVDFDPVKAKIAVLAEGGSREQAELAAMCAISGKSETELAHLQHQNPDHYQQLAQTAALFPSAMVESDLGEIPEGWGVRAFQEIADVIMGQSPAGDTYNSEANGMPLINGPVEFGDYFPEKTKWTTSPTKVAAKGDLVVCVRGSTTGRFVKSDDQYSLGRGVCAIRGKQSQCFVDLFFKHNIESLLQLATGSTFPNWSSQTLNSFLVISPTDSLSLIFEEKIKALVAKLESGVGENHYLSQLRDTLLPKLLSGEIDLTNLQSEVA